MSAAENDDLNADPEIETPADDQTDDLEDDLLEDGEGAEDDEESTEDDEASVDPAAAALEGEEPPRVSRRTARVQKLEKERDEANRREADALRRLADAQAGMRSDPNVEAARQAEAARVAAMDPAERERYEDKKRIDALQSQVNNLGFAQADGLDRARFEAKAELNPVYKKYMPAVEQALIDMRKNGVNTTREAILTYKLGEAARRKLEGNSKSVTEKKAAAERRIERSRGTPANRRADSSASGKGKTEEDRLRGIQI